MHFVLLFALAASPVEVKVVVDPSKLSNPASYEYVSLFDASGVRLKAVTKHESFSTPTEFKLPPGRYFVKDHARRISFTEFTVVAADESSGKTVELSPGPFSLQLDPSKLGDKNATPFVRLSTIDAKKNTAGLTLGIREPVTLTLPDGDYALTTYSTAAWFGRFTVTGGAVQQRDAGILITEKKLEFDESQYRCVTLALAKLATVGAHQLVYLRDWIQRPNAVREGVARINSVDTRLCLPAGTYDVALPDHREPFGEFTIGADRKVTTRSGLRLDGQTLRVTAPLACVAFEPETFAKDELVYLDTDVLPEAFISFKKKGTVLIPPGKYAVLGYRQGTPLGTLEVSQEVTGGVGFTDCTFGADRANTVEFELQATTKFSVDPFGKELTKWSGRLPLGEWKLRRNNVPFGSVLVERGGVRTSEGSGVTVRVPQAEENTAQQREPANDVDEDGVDDRGDNCVGIPNADQRDADSNGRGDACELKRGGRR